MHLPPVAPLLVGQSTLFAEAVVQIDPQYFKTDWADTERSPDEDDSVVRAFFEQHPLSEILKYETSLAKTHFAFYHAQTGFRVYRDLIRLLEEKRTGKTFPEDFTFVRFPKASYNHTASSLTQTYHLADTEAVRAEFTKGFISLIDELKMNGLDVTPLDPSNEEDKAFLKFVLIGIGFYSESSEEPAEDDQADLLLEHWADKYVAISKKTDEYLAILEKRKLSSLLQQFGLSCQLDLDTEDARPIAALIEEYTKKNPEEKTRFIQGFIQLFNALEVAAYLPDGQKISLNAKDAADQALVKEAFSKIQSARTSPSGKMVPTEPKFPEPKGPLSKGDCLHRSITTGHMENAVRDLIEDRLHAAKIELFNRHNLKYLTYNDISSEVSAHLLATNIFLQGNFNYAPHCTLAYWKFRRNVTTFSTKELLAPVLNHYGIPQEKLPALEALAKKIAEDDSAILAIMLPKDESLINSFAYLCGSLGMTKTCFIGISMFEALKTAQADPRKLPALDSIQARLIINEKGVLNPDSEIKIRVFDTIPADKLEEYQEELKTWVSSAFSAERSSL